MRHPPEWLVLLVRKRLQSSLKKALQKYLGELPPTPLSRLLDAPAVARKLGPPESKDLSIDHIIPLWMFDFRDFYQIRLCYSPQNLRWMDTIQNNNVKGGQVPEEIPPELSYIWKIVQANLKKPDFRESRIGIIAELSL